AIATLRDDLVRARAERWANPLVYGLAALALLATALAALAWRRARGEPGRPWWRPAATTAGSRQDDHSPSALREGGVEPTAFEAHDPGPPADSAAPAGASGERAARAEGGADPAPSGFGDSILGPRSVRAEEVRDVQQEADFFFSLGEHERAIEVLRNHIAANPDTSAVAWLDLLDILHRTGQRQEFQWLREDFERTFHVDVPEFDAYTEGEGPDLEAYPEALERITAVWPSTQVLDHIEEAVFRRPRLGADAPMSLGAYRDLLMLHHLCEEVLSRAATARVTGAAFAPMATQVLRTVHAAEAADTRPEADGPGAARADLDFNLDDAAPEPDLLIGGPPSVQPQDNLLDFDLPDIDTTAMRPKKTRE
ncbi:MAG TPA: hypothetical protein VEA40_19520, partial [Ramlibacter sp.]|nr:hypothetical protein [Ramlibacter sp.]